MKYNNIIVFAVFVISGLVCWVADPLARAQPMDVNSAGLYDVAQSHLVVVEYSGKKSTYVMNDSEWEEVRSSLQGGAKYAAWNNYVVTFGPEVQYAEWIPLR